MAEHRARGAALLIVLGTLTVTMAACAAVARFAATARASQRAAWHARVADDLAAAAEQAIAGWLDVQAHKVVLRPDNEAPAIGVVDEGFALGAISCRVQVTAYDQCGMVPWSLARTGSPLRLVIPRALLKVLDRVPADRAVLPGLDLFAGEAGSTTVFPAIPECRGDVALGAWIATHSPGLRLNVNTAPMALIEAALRSLGRGGSEAIEAARRDGRVTPMDAAPNQREGLRLAGASNAWAFRVDATAGALRRSWWVVFTKPGQSWRCQQRLMITL